MQQRHVPAWQLVEVSMQRMSDERLMIEEASMRVRVMVTPGGV